MNDNKIQITLSKDLQPQYVNMATINNNGEEFVIDFIQTMPENTGEIKSRVIMSLANAKQFAATLQEQVQRMENIKK